MVGTTFILGFSALCILNASPPPATVADAVSANVPVNVNPVESCMIVYVVYVPELVNVWTQYVVPPEM